MFRNKSADAHQFAMIPRADIPRSSFKLDKGYKTTFDGGWLIPVFIEETLPGDTFSVRMTAFSRLATPLYPIMDNLHLDSFFFFVPNRLVWDNWQKFMGEQKNPGDSISYVIPTMTSPTAGYTVGSLQDYMGLPTVGQVGGGNTISHSSLPLRAYNLIWNEWFRDENLQNSVVVDVDDGPDTYTDYIKLKRGKRRDYFTSSLPWPQKGDSVSLPLGTSARVLADGVGAGVGSFRLASTGGGGATPFAGDGTNVPKWSTGTIAVGTMEPSPAGGDMGMYADLSTATAATINQLRQSFQIQKLLERDARGGTRYTEIVRAHFGVTSPDARLQRPEYLGGGSSPININPVAQTSATNLTGGSTPLANLSGIGTGLTVGHGFTQSFTEHGHIIGLVSVRADLNYQQGIRRFWKRSTRYDFYFPAFAMLGEQAVLNQEIYMDGSANDTQVWGYQERWAEYRYNPNQITGLFKSTSAGTIDPWHLAQKFTTLPTLGDTFIKDTPPIDRVVAVGAGANGQQLLFDAIFSIKAARPLPMYSVPGLIDHF